MLLDRPCLISASQALSNRLTDLIDQITAQTNELKLLEQSEIKEQRVDSSPQLDDDVIRGSHSHFQFFRAAGELRDVIQEQKDSIVE